MHALIIIHAISTDAGRQTEIYDWTDVPENRIRSFVMTFHKARIRIIIKPNRLKLKSSISELFRKKAWKTDKFLEQYGESRVLIFKGEFETIQISFPRDVVLQ